MAQNIGYQINIAGFTVQTGAVGAAKLMGSDWFKRRYGFRIFFNQILYAAYRHTPTLKGEEKRIFTAGFRNDPIAFFQIVQKGFLYLGTEIYRNFLTAFSVNTDTSILKVNISNIQTYTLRYTNPGSKQESHNGKIPGFGFIVVGFLLICQFIALFHLIQQESDLIHI